MASVVAVNRKEPWSHRPIGIWTIRIVTFIVLIAAWELYGRTTNPALFEPPSVVVEAFFELAIESTILWSAIRDSLTALLAGFSIAIVVGIFMGLVMGRFRAVEYVLDPYVSFLYALPTIALVPLFIIWLGIGAATRILIVAEIAVVPVLLNTLAGAKQVNEDLVDVARNYEASRVQILRTIVLPSIAPYILVGINVGIGTALIGMILGEMLIVVRGIGGLVVQYSNAFEPARVIVALLAIIMLSLILTTTLRHIRHRLLPWSDV